MLSGNRLSTIELLLVLADPFSGSGRLLGDSRCRVQVSFSMTGDEFRSLYQLGDRLTGPPVVTHRATDASGSQLLVHFVVEGEGESGVGILELFAKLEGAEKQRVREVVDVEGRQTVVTDLLTGFSTFRNWVEEAVSSQGAPKEPGAYTQLFRVPEALAGAGPPEEPVPPPPQAEEPVPPPPQAEVKGPENAPVSYTMLFGAGNDAPSEPVADLPPSVTQELQSSVASAPEEVPVPEDPAPSPPLFPTPGPPTPSGPDERREPSGSPLPWELGGEGEPLPPVVQTEPDPPRPAEPPPPEAPARVEAPDPGKKEKDKPGAYTQVFGRPTPGGAPPPTREEPTPHGAVPPYSNPPWPPAQPPAPESSPPDWQRWRDTPGAAGRHIPSDDYLGRLGGSQSMRPGPVPPTSRVPGDAERSASPPPQAFPGGNDLPRGPGHYTMVQKGISPESGYSAPLARPAPGPGSPEPAPKPASRPSRRSSLLTILGLVAVLVIIVALVVVFALTG